MSNKSRGNAFELKIKKILEGYGFEVDKARAAFIFTAPGKGFSTPNDFFGCADLMGIHPEKSYTLFIQCTLGDRGARRKKLEAVPWNLAHQRVQLWSRSTKKRGQLFTQQLFNTPQGFDWVEHLFIPGKEAPPL